MHHPKTFETLHIWRETVQNDLQSGQTEDFKLRLLLEQGKFCEQAIFGCLKDAIFELHEAKVWGLIDDVFAESQRSQLYNHAAQELLNDKFLIVELAREHDLLERYRKEIRMPINHSVSDYDKLGELQIALLVWRANLARDISLCSKNKQEEEMVLCEGMCAAQGLVNRCADASTAFWTSQQMTHAPHTEDKNSVKKKAMEKVIKSMRELMEAHNLGKECLDRVMEPIGRSDPCVALNELASPGENRYIIE